MSKQPGTVFLCLWAAVLAASTAVAAECNDRMDVISPTARFTLHGDGTVTDVRTGLRWQRCPVGYTLNDNGTADRIGDDRCAADGVAAFNWQAALQAAADLNGGGGLAGFTDWRVPNVKELASIVEFRCFDPAINGVVFPDTESVMYWSTTTINRIDSALGIDFEDGANAWSYKDVDGFAHPVRLVRGG